MGMIASPKPPCNAEGTQSEGRARDLGQMGATNNRSIIKAGIPGRDTPKDTPARIPTLRVATTTRHPDVLDFLVAVRQLENVPEEVPAVVAQASFWLVL
jgi:hypothetical protein